MEDCNLKHCVQGSTKFFESSTAELRAEQFPVLPGYQSLCQFPVLPGGGWVLDMAHGMLVDPPQPTAAPSAWVEDEYDGLLTH
jgi:hypothetical protein